MEVERFLGEADLADLVDAFETCRLPVEAFRHRHHLAVAAVYLEAEPFDAAMARMRERLLAFTRHHGVDAYHETLTRFWMELVAHELAAEPAAAPLSRRVDGVIRRLGRKDLAREHYSAERLDSDAARRGWLAPDRRPLPAAG